MHHSVLLLENISLILTVNSGSKIISLQASTSFEITKMCYVGVEKKQGCEWRQQKLISRLPKTLELRLTDINTEAESFGRTDSGIGQP